MNKKNILWIAHCAIGGICGVVCMVSGANDVPKSCRMVVVAIGVYLFSKTLIAGQFLEKKEKKEV